MNDVSATVMSRSAVIVLIAIVVIGDYCNAVLAVGEKTPMDDRPVDDKQIRRGTYA